MPNPTYTPAQLADEVQTLAENYRGAVDEIDTDNDIFSDISTALQQKTGQVDPYDKEDIADTISDDLVFPSGTLNISSNGDYDVSAKETAHVAVPGPNLVAKQIIANGTYAAAEDNADGYSEVEVNVPDESKAVLNSLIDRSITIVTNDATSIGGYAFYYCTALTEVNFPNVSSIGDHAFYYCTALTEVNFPNVSSIGDRAFGHCTALQYYDMSEVDMVPIIHIDAFKSTTCIFLFRDQAQLDEYASATNWSTYADRFQIKEAIS